MRMAEPLLPAHASEDGSRDRAYPSEAGDLTDVRMRQEIPFPAPVPAGRLTAAALFEATADEGAVDR